jgi:hypothetical protein
MDTTLVNGNGDGGDDQRRDISLSPFEISADHQQSVRF